MKVITFDSRSWTLVGKSRIRPALLSKVGEAEGTPVHTAGEKGTVSDVIYLTAPEGTYWVYRELPARGPGGGAVLTGAG